MKKSDLFREYARVIDLCEGTKVKPWECVRIDNGIYHTYKDHPSFNTEPERYTFALAIVDDRPVFKNDYIYVGLCGDKYSANKELFYMYRGNFFSWNPPKPKTVMVELLREDAEEITKYPTAWKNIAEACKKALNELTY